MNKIIELGSITLSCRAVVSDPCYDREVWCMEDNISVKPGEYHAYAVSKDEGRFGIRIASLICINRLSLPDLKSALERRWKTIGSIGVDSGQAGIFDNSVYPVSRSDMGEYGKPDTFYGECCDITLSDTSCGRLKSGKGIVSSSGYGDGSYTLKALCEKETNIALMIDFALVSKRKIMEALVERKKQITIRRI